MILVIDATVTDAGGNVFSGSVAVSVNLPAAPAAPAAETAQPPAQAQLAPFQQRSLMLSRGGWGQR